MDKLALLKAALANRKKNKKPVAGQPPAVTPAAVGAPQTATAPKKVVKKGKKPAAKATGAIFFQKAKPRNGA